MSTLVSTVLAGARTPLNDLTVGAYRWSDAALISYLNDIILEIVAKDDRAYPVRVPAQLVPGTVLQTNVLPSDGSLVKHLGVTRNLRANATAPGGYLPGPAIVKVSNIEIMDRQTKNWYSSPFATEIQNWIPSGEDYEKFFVWPPPGLTIPVWVELLYTVVPPQMVAVTDTIPIRDKYRFQMQIGVVGRALMQDIPEGDLPRGKIFMDLFYASLKQGS
jgi:hypothetical protein